MNLEEIHELDQKGIDEQAKIWGQERYELLQARDHVYMVRFVSGHMPSTAIERDEGIFSSQELAEKWIKEEYEVFDEYPGDDRLYIEKHPVDKMPPSNESLVVKEIAVADLLEIRRQAVNYAG